MPRSYYGGVTDWCASENDPTSIVSLSQTVSTSTNVLTVTLTAPQTAGVYNASVQVQCSDVSTVNVPISLNRSAQLRTIYLPLVRR